MPDKTAKAQPEIKRDLKKEYTDARNSMTNFRGKWNNMLDIAYARLSTEKGFKSRVREGSLSSLLWERSARVVAQLPTGRIRSLSKSDEGKSLLMDKVWHKYVVKHANTDYSFPTKLRMWDYYSLVYGAMPMFYDYRIDDEYVGPDATLLDPRYCFPQVGRTSLHSAKKVFVETYHDPSYLKSKLGLDGWNDQAINQVLKDHDEKKQPNTDGTDITNLQEDRGQTNDLHQGQIKLVTQYERGRDGRWITFAPDYDCELYLRDIPNPHESGRIPVVFKYAMPLIDSIWGMGDVERGESLQKAVDTTVNLNLDFGKFKLYPPMWYKDGINKSQLRYEPGAKWKLSEPWGQSAGFVTTGAAPTNEFQVMYQFLKGALLNQNGTTDATISSDDKIPGQGKTPQALDRLEKRENARDQWDRNMFEEAYEELVGGMINLIGTKQAVPINFHIFDEDINDLIKAGYRDILDLYDSARSFRIEDGQLSEYVNSKGTAEATIQPEHLAGKYMFEIDANSSAANDESEEYERVVNAMEFLNTPTGQKMLQEAEAKGRPVHLDELLNQFFVTSGMRNRDKIYPAQPEDTADTDVFDPESIQDPALRAQYEDFIARKQGGQLPAAPAAATPIEPAVMPTGGNY